MKTGEEGRVDIARCFDQEAESSEEVYDRLAGYGFARRYVRGRSVADIGWEELGRGARLLGDRAKSVASMSGSSEAVELASALYPAPNVVYGAVDLLKLPYPDGAFDAATAFGVVENLEDPEGFVREARRILGPEGILVISTPDRQANSNERNRWPRPGEMYAKEFRELLGRHFGNVRMYRQGAVAGSLVFPENEPVSDVEVEGARLSVSAPAPGAEPPATRFVLAVCGDAEIPDGERPYLLLDRDRGVFEECEDGSEDVALLGEEIRWMQETEVEEFMEALRLHRLGRLSPRRVEKLEARLEAIEGSRLWRMFEPYRRLRARLAAGVRGDKKAREEAG